MRLYHNEYIFLGYVSPVAVVHQLGLGYIPHNHSYKSLHPTPDWIDCARMEIAKHMHSKISSEQSPQTDIHRGGIGNRRIQQESSRE